MADQPKPTQPVSYAPVPQPMTEREAARERLRASVDALTREASLQAQLQKEPLKMLGGASAVGAVIGLMMGRSLRRSKKIYVDAGSPVKHQKALIKAQKKQAGTGVSGALVATLGTLAIRSLTEKVLTPKLEELSGSMLQKAGQPGAARSNTGTKAGSTPTVTTPGVPVRVTPSSLGPATVTGTAASSNAVSAGASSGTSPVASFLKHPGVVPTPESRVEAKAVGTPIAPEERSNPNAR
ncbi:hypothetical protein DEDE109153_07350 [Deinococcus deserti]|uniref:Uncharacterized protein n=1 Tax=Deinococcus deserti (strain DSM 17065 / CIP 109153 / LMG 22923 / VCD115) TaxID=546414 RepID=C1CWK3_DEIDV|nr:hypothetical protein [Deinococcus deserti]ACO46570.1 hypothetical protein Deide_16050 [Deinococcus deserti VCD115]